MSLVRGRAQVDIPVFNAEGRMHAFAFVLASAVIVSISSTATADPKQDALQVLEKWSKAFGDSDVDGIVKLYAPDALFLGTGSKTVVTKPEGIRTYFEQAFG